MFENREQVKFHLLKDKEHLWNMKGAILQRQQCLQYDSVPKETREKLKTILVQSASKKMDARNEDLLGEICA